MSKLYIGFSYPKKFKIGAYAIAKWYNTQYSHVYIRFESQSIKSTVYHAAHGMVHFRSLDNFLQENNTIKEYKIEVTDSQKSKILNKCIDLSGESYSYLQLTKIFFMDVTYRLGIKAYTTDSKGYICSELVGKISCEELNIKYNKPLFLLTPVDIECKFDEVFCYTLGVS